MKSGGDIDALSRASFAGLTGAYDPRPLVYHHHGRRDPATEAEVRRGYDLGRGAFHLKCLLDPRRRAAYAKPILRRMIDYVLQGQLRILAGEL